MGVPIVNLGFSEEYKEQVFGMRSEEGVEITAPGVTEQVNDLADLGLEEWLEAHGDLINALEEAWGNITDIVDLDTLSEFITSHDVADRLFFDVAMDPTKWVENFGAAGLAAAVEINVLMIMIFLDEFIPFLEDKVNDWEEEVENELQKQLESLAEGEGGGGSSMGDEEIDEMFDDVVNDFFDGLDPDDVEPDDIDELEEELDELDQDLDEFEDDMNEADFEVDFGEDIEKRVHELRELLRLQKDAVKDAAVHLERSTIRRGRSGLDGG